MLWSAPRLLERHGFESELAPSGAPRGSSAEAPRKLRGSSAHPQLCSTLYESRSGYSLKVALTLEKLEIYDSQDPNA